MRVEFKRQVSLDTVIAAFVLFVTLVGCAWSLGGQIAELRVKVDAMWARFEKGDH